MIKKEIHALEFQCDAGLKFIERCKACAKEGKCTDRVRTKALINGEKTLVYGLESENKGCLSEILEYFDQESKRG